MTTRIAGIDAARGLAVIGMIIVNFKVVLGDKGWIVAEVFASVFAGKAAATFVVLAGVGIALSLKKPRLAPDQAALRQAKAKIFKRAIILLLLGTSYLAIWPADILHFYGIYLLLLLLALSLSQKAIFALSLSIILLFPVLLLRWDYAADWQFETLQYQGLWTWRGFLKNLFFNGFHPVIPWVAFMFIGYWLGRLDLDNVEKLKKIFISSLGIFIIIHLLSLAGLQLLDEVSEVEKELFDYLLGFQPMPPLPLYMLNGISIAFVVISGCILLSRHHHIHGLMNALGNLGKLALTCYLAHVVLGMGLI